MIGILQKKNGVLCGKCGYKVLKMIDSACSVESRLNGEPIMITFEESDIVKETMTTLTISNCIVLDNCHHVDKSKLVHEMNSKHMNRFAANYCSSFQKQYDLTKFESMDVIDLKNISVIKSNEVLDKYPVFHIEESKAEVVLCGLHPDLFSTETQHDCLYLVVPNSWHRIQQDDQEVRLVIDDSERSPKNDLLFIKFSRDSLLAYLNKTKAA